MYKVKSENEEERFKSLDEAMEYARNLGILVEISTPQYQIVGKLGVDSIKEGKCPDGHDYTWRKRRA
jgi:hypothetical protein